jgi:hypothetical protein
VDQWALTAGTSLKKSTTNTYEWVVGDQVDQWALTAGDLANKEHNKHVWMGRWGSMALTAELVKEVAHEIKLLVSDKRLLMCASFDRI